MTALELIIRHRVRRVLIVCPSSLQIQWREQMRDKFGLVLLDVMMPGPDGPATPAALRLIDPEVRAAFMTGYAGGRLAGHAGTVLSKPFSLGDLAEAVRLALA